MFRLKGELGGKVERQMKVEEVEFRPEAEFAMSLLSREFFHTRKRCVIVQLKVRRLVSVVKQD